MQKAPSPRFIYLIQGDCTQKPVDVPTGSDFLFLQWQPTFIPRPNNFHFPRSTWASGRNELLRRAKEKGEYDYFVFLDDDVKIGHASLRKIGTFIRRIIFAYVLHMGRGEFSGISNLLFQLWHVLRHARKAWSLRDFEKEVERTKPLIAYPNVLMPFRWYEIASRRAVDSVTFGDTLFVCIHRSIIDRVLPYNTQYDRENWWMCGHEFCCKAQEACAPGKIHRYNRLIVSNEASRPYPRPKRGTWVIPKNVITKPDLS